jgi:hypothetical protein
VLRGEENIKNEDRWIHFYLNVDAIVGDTNEIRVPKTYSLTSKILAHTTETIIEQIVTAVDNSRADI